MKKKAGTIKDALREVGARDGLLVMDRFMTPVRTPDGTFLSDELIGYCRYQDGILIPEDGDSYDIDEKIDGFEYHKGEEGEEDYLIVWERAAALEIPISEPWFSMVRDGRKKEEYREIKPYWTSRFQKLFPFVKNTNIPFDNSFCHWIRLRNGYGKERPSIMIHVSLKRGYGKPEWGAEDGKEYYVMLIHDICEERGMHYGHIDNIHRTGGGI